jgi:hypothetical protein
MVDSTTLVGFATPMPAIAGNGLTVVVFGTVAFSLIMSVAFLLTRSGSSGSMYDEIGSGGISREEGGGGTGGHHFSAAALRSEQEQEVRQMLQARSERLVRRGEAPLDVDAETARLLAEADASAPTGRDSELEDEVRQLVIARNERRLRAGQEPLDVEAEVARTIRELSP